MYYSNLCLPAAPLGGPPEVSELGPHDAGGELLSRRKPAGTILQLSHF